MIFILHICVADDTTSLSAIQKMISTIEHLDMICEHEVSNDKVLTHGTICVSLLIESLRKLRIDNQVKVTFHSLSDSKSPLSLTELINVFGFCKEQNVDILSLSVGLTNRFFVNEIQNAIENIGKTLIVAALSNSLKITYPASLPNVLGVKYSLSNDPHRFSLNPNSIDGTDLIVNALRTSLLRKIEERFEINCSRSNSILVPQICAEIAARSLQQNEPISKSAALNWLTNGHKVTSGGLHNEWKYNQKHSDIPIIFLPYNDDNTDILLSKACALKDLFEREEYLCSIISDLIQSANFLNAYYPLNTDNCIQCLGYYQYAISDSLILIITSDKYDIRCIADTTICNWTGIDTSELYKYILSFFSEEKRHE